MKKKLPCTPDPPDRLKLYDLQNGLCWLCWKPIDMSIKNVTARDYATIDHYIPLSKGGKNEWANKMLAHAQCNQGRGNELPKISRGLAFSVLRHVDELL